MSQASDDYPLSMTSQFRAMHLCTACQKQMKAEDDPQSIGCGCFACKSCFSPDGDIFCKRCDERQEHLVPATDFKRFLENCLGSRRCCTYCYATFKRDLEYECYYGNCTGPICHECLALHKSDDNEFENHWYQKIPNQPSSGTPVVDNTTITPAPPEATSAEPSTEERRVEENEVSIVENVPEEKEEPEALPAASEKEDVAQKIESLRKRLNETLENRAITGKDFVEKEAKNNRVLRQDLNKSETDLEQIIKESQEELRNIRILKESCVVVTHPPEGCAVPEVLPKPHVGPSQDVDVSCPSTECIPETSQLPSQDSNDTRVPQKNAKVFGFFGFKQKELSSLVAILTLLKRPEDRVKNKNETPTHLIIERRCKLNPTAEMLCVMFSGGWILSKRYLLASFKAKNFLREEDFELKDLLVEYVNYKVDPSICRKAIKRKGKPFDGLNILLVSSDTDFAPKFLTAGGGKVLRTTSLKFAPQFLTDYEKDHSEASVTIVYNIKSSDSNQFSEKELRERKKIFKSCHQISLHKLLKGVFDGCFSCINPNKRSHESSSPSVASDPSTKKSKPND